MSQHQADVVRISLFDTRPIVRGQQVRIRVRSAQPAGEHTVEVDSIDSERLYLATATATGEPVALPPGTEVSLIITSMHGRHEFRTAVEHCDSGPGSLMSILLPPEAQRLQRRRHARVAAGVPVEVAKLPGPDERLAALVFTKAMTRNVSEGGFAFASPGLALAPGDLVSVSMIIPGANQTLRATCEVVRAETDVHSYAVRFVDVNERSVIGLRAFIQSQRRKRGMSPSAS